MMNPPSALRSSVVFFTLFLTHALGAIAAKPLPEALKPWQNWATWGAEHRNCPTPWNNHEKHFCFWPGALSLSVDRASGSWSLDVATFQDALNFH